MTQALAQKLRHTMDLTIRLICLSLETVIALAGLKLKLCLRKFRHGPSMAAVWLLQILNLLNISLRPSWLSPQKSKTIGHIDNFRDLASQRVNQCQTINRTQILPTFCHEMEPKIRGSLDMSLRPNWLCLEN